jgi:predicted amino acid dehydrogenase
VIESAHVSAGAVILDVAVPGDVHGDVVVRDDCTVIAGATVALPALQRLDVAGLDLPGDRIYACLAETLLCGLSRITEDALIGAPSRERVELLTAAAMRHGFRF